jgi:threonine dehydrogenase-like Zn-dependent dehydrogenase
MQALVWEAPRVMAMRERAQPALQPGEALIRVAFVGICGSELSGYLGHNALRVPPLVMGHEFAGELVALGDAAQSRNPGLTVGQSVTVNPLAYCGRCVYCERGDNQLCVSRQLIGAHRPGAYAEYVTAPAELVAPLPEGMSLRIGALTEPVAVAVRIGEMAGRLAGEAALVIGAGPIGLLALQVLRAQGASPVFIADLDAARLNMGAAQCDAGGRGHPPGNCAARLLRIFARQLCRGAPPPRQRHVASRSLDRRGTSGRRRPLVRPADRRAR